MKKVKEEALLQELKVRVSLLIADDFAKFLVSLIVEDAEHDR